MRAALNELELPDSVDELSVIHIALIFFALPRLRALALFVFLVIVCLLHLRSVWSLTFTARGAKAIRL